ncbi:uncharacterized protein PRCAT00003352001 [Priceomyces carsonii]|uniref:uncharacterized protein n=1 Tax=Priceomyces carsonii TaxID=28549 RepID=UPI002ED86A70|nr:unnamed protein product [Priceomyces carsonii]
MNFDEREDNDGVRLSWNCLPKSKMQHHRNVVPLGSLYTPLNNKSEIPIAGKENVTCCRQCRSFINPFVAINDEIWHCQFCGFSNRINVSQGIPLGLNPECSTIEYQTGRTSSFPPLFFYVVDTCFDSGDIKEAFESLKESLTISLSLLPENALIGFISYGKHVQVHDLTNQGASSIYAFNGNKEYTSEQIQKAMGLLAPGLRAHSSHEPDPIIQILGPIGKRFVQPVHLVEYQVTKIIESLVPNVFPHSEMKERPARATGVALGIAANLLSSIIGVGGSSGGHIMCFIGGACTYGPGKIVGQLLKEPLRSHHDIMKSTQVKLPSVNLQSTTQADLSLLRKAKKYYSGIAKTLVTMGLSCDFFIGSYDQIGLFEMEEICHKTGGIVVMSDSFSTSIFKQSLMKFLRKENEESDYLDMAFNATLECHVTSDLKIKGLIGHATALPVSEGTPNSKYISHESIGEGNTNSWKLCNADTQVTYAIYFEKLDSLNLNFSYIQYLFHYEHPSGEMRLRVTTTPISIVSDTDPMSLESGFDQETALVLIAREAVNKLQLDSSNFFKSYFEPFDIVKQLDKTLFDFCSRFAVYRQGDLSSFSLSSTYAMLPQFMYHLRRSVLINVFNSSPDETCFTRHVFMHEDLTNSLIIIQPTLLSYDIDSFGEIDENGEPNTEGIPVLLDSLSLGHGKILLLDTFFQILIYHGSKVASWRKAGYQDMEDYSYFKEFLEAPKQEAVEILVDRFPLPRFIDCDEGGSQARFLMARLNPSTSYATNPNHLYGAQLDVFTDDISLQLFMDHIQRMIVAKK